MAIIGVIAAEPKGGKRVVVGLVVLPVVGVPCVLSVLFGLSNPYRLKPQACQTQAGTRRLLSAA